jgi:hypothetical protein
MNRFMLALLCACSVAALAQDPKAKPAVPAKPAAATAPAKAAPAAAIVANKETKTFHRADCKAAAKIKDANKTTFASAAEAQKAGYKACKVCKP